MGNHDNEADLSDMEIINLDKTNPYSLSKFAITNLSGVSNYAIDVSSSINKGEPGLKLWFFDSGRDNGCADYVDANGCVGYKIIEWYNDQSAQFRNDHGDYALHLGFLHIPVSEYVQAAMQNLTRGFKNEDVTCSKHDTGLFKSVVKNQNIKALFCGHDHVNDYAATYQGVELVYGSKAGWSVAGKGLRGVLIKVKETILNGVPRVEYQHHLVDVEGVPTYIKQDKGYFDKQIGCDRFLAPVSNSSDPSNITSTLTSFRINWAGINLLILLSLLLLH